MTHDELLQEIDAIIFIGYAESGFSEYAANGTRAEKALRAVAELHKPYYSNFVDESLYSDDGGLCFGCMNSTGDEPPAWKDCPTIQAIEKELK